MRRTQKRCQMCHQWFEPVRASQKTCYRKKCRRERHRRNCEAWRRHNQGKGPAACKVRTWAAMKKYWRTWRQEHPGYRRRDNLRRKMAHRAAKRDLKKRIYVEK